MLVEIQALATPSDLAQPRRVAVGIEPRRLALSCAVLNEKTDTRLGKKDVFVSAAGGLTIKEPAADLALCLALASAEAGTVVDPKTVPIGEFGLSGEIRRVPGVDRRLSEARRLGFNRAILPEGTESTVADMDLIYASDLRRALQLATPDGARL